MQAAGVWEGQLCLPVARLFNRHAHISRLSTLPLYHTASISGLRFDKLKLQPSLGLLQVSSSVEEHTQQSNAGTKVVKVKFVLQRRCEFGQRFYVIGDEELLGAWAPEAAIPMQWSEGHIWTAEQDLSVGMCMEFKIILMAEQEVIEWQPGPNQKVEFSGAPSSLVVFVPWSDEEGDLKREPQVDTAINEHIRTQDDVVTASSAGKPPDWVEDIESETLSNKSAEVVEEQLSEERITDNGMVIINAKDVSDEQQTEAKGMVIGHLEVTDARTILSSELKFSEFILSFPIPESWYGEEVEQTSKISSSHDLAESSPVSPEEIAKEKTVSSDFQLSSDIYKEENGEQLMSLNWSDEVISEERASSMSEPILKDENDEEQRVGEWLKATDCKSVEVISEGRASPMSEISEGRASSMSEPILKDENDGERRVSDVVVEVTSQRDVGTFLSDIKLKDTDDEETINKKHEVQNGSAEVIAESRSETMISTTVSNNEDQSDKEALVNNDPTVPTTEVPKLEKPSMTTDSLEKVETKPSMAAKEKKSGQTGWSKLWDAFVKGRNI